MAICMALDQVRHFSPPEWLICGTAAGLVRGQEILHRFAAKVAKATRQGVETAGQHGMMQVRIKQRPFGNLPDWVRDAWIGLTLPAVNARPRRFRGLRVEPGQPAPGKLRVWAMLLTGKLVRYEGFLVRTRDALAVLAEVRPDAAEWIDACAPHYRKSRYMIFDTASCEPLVGTDGGAIWLGAKYKRWFPASPGRIATMWLSAMLLSAADSVCFARYQVDTMVDALLAGGAPLLAGLLAAWVMRLRSSVLHLLCALATLAAWVQLIRFLVTMVLPQSADATVGAVCLGAQFGGTTALIAVGLRQLRSPGRRVAGYLMAISVMMGTLMLPGLGHDAWLLAAVVQPWTGRAVPEKADDHVPDVTADQLWEAQPGLLEQQIAALHPRVASWDNVYALAIAPSGEQDLFGREAHAALSSVFTHFGAASRGGVLLSNAEVDQLQVPLATRASIEGAAQAIAGKVDPTRDVVFVYLVSHGSKDAELTSRLADYSAIQPITAASTALALNGAHIRRRIVVVSACYAGSWIPALANDDTIVITAAAKDRTSLGCDDSRDMTVFGEALLGSMASPAVSLHDAFEDAKRKVTRVEAQSNVSPSYPQAFVGAHMQDLWLGRKKG